MDTPANCQSHVRYALKDTHQYQYCTLNGCCFVARSLSIKKIIIIIIFFFFFLRFQTILCHRASPLTFKDTGYCVCVAV